MFRKVLIANRGEIALRDPARLPDARASRRSSPTARPTASRSPVQLADEAICIGPADAKRSYLSAPAVISAALVTGCDAIHPGYGFLSEDEGFAEVVAAHGLTFIGPPADVLERFASKAGTRQLLGAHGLPTIPGSDGMLRDDMHALGEAERIGYPVLIKPSAGGGGKGMRMVRTAARARVGRSRVCRSRGQGRVRRRLALPREVARREPPRRGPGRGRPLRPRRPPRRARLLGPAAPPEDPRGGADAGPVRRPPAPTSPSAPSGPSSRPATRTSARSSSSSTRTGDFYFIEINCRIQVEHPVTEMLTGIDLVATQIRIAAGEPLGFTPGRRRRSRGHAIEFRINAEDPAHDFRPRRRRRRALPRAGRPGRPDGLAPVHAATRCRRSTTRCSASSSSGARTGRPPSPAAGSRSTSSSSTAS